ncbi:unnamed protein product [Ceutorhynchus assimilis]|uniref:Uncharacterized protein n=1 Tax=Ceutorhynchus assimilis TaxID=467358 RepID=A0A9N9MGU2_9CUCU|nr:unnamed protein product [Ceutorhynchus assimilis]
MTDFNYITFQKRLRREKRTRKRLQDQLDLEVNRRAQLEEALRNAGAAEQLDTINEKLAQQTPIKPPTPNQLLQLHQQQASPPALAVERLPDRIKQETEEPQQYVTPREAPLQHQENSKAPTWGYSGLDLMSSGAAFWQNYSETLAQELEMERKSRLQQAERDVKSPLQDRTGYFKNSVMFTSSAT